MRALFMVTMLGLLAPMLTACGDPVPYEPPYLRDGRMLAAEFDARLARSEGGEHARQILLEACDDVEYFVSGRAATQVFTEEIMPRGREQLPLYHAILKHFIEEGRPLDEVSNQIYGASFFENDYVINVHNPFIQAAAAHDGTLEGAASFCGREITERWTRDLVLTAMIAAELGEDLMLYRQHQDGSPLSEEEIEVTRTREGREWLLGPSLEQVEDAMNTMGIPYEPLPPAPEAG